MKKLIITMGDPAGIGCEVSLKALDREPKFRDKTMLIGSRSVVEYYAKDISLSNSLHFIQEPEDFKVGVINILDHYDMVMEDHLVGRIHKTGGDAAFAYVKKAIELALENRVQAVVTGPLNKEALRLAGHDFDGHTEIFSQLTNTKKYAMMLWSEELTVVHNSTHCSLIKACQRVKKARVLDCIDLTWQALKDLGKKDPFIAVAGLNPHSGESGLFGREEIDEIIPAIKAAKSKGIQVDGPVPPDTVFLKARQKKYDAVIAMYHDQGHIPSKLLAFDTGVNTTLGLPILRTSVDHGTAFDIAGQNLASETSMLAALALAEQFAENRCNENGGLV